MQDNTYGKVCEIKAKNYLERNGYKILATNYKNKIGEIDIIAKEKDVIVFVEVKGRHSRLFGDPLEAINENKQSKIRRIATAYLMSKKALNCKCRFDAISVLGELDEEIKHIKNAF